MAYQEIKNFTDINTPSISTINSPAVQAQLSGISTLPDDILLYLFHMATYASDPETLTPVTLSHISLRWRELALYAPMLWTSIAVSERLSTTMLSFERTLSRVPRYLERSKDLPLSLRVNLYSFHAESSIHDPAHPFAYNIRAFRHYSRRLSALLGHHVARFKNVVLMGDEFESIQDIQTSFPHVPMPLLESYRVWQRDDYQCLSDDVRHPTQIDALAIPLRPYNMTVEESAIMYPKLDDLTLKGIPLEWYRFAPRNLQYLHLGFLPIGARPTGEDFRQILLANEHSLEALKIQGACPITLSAEPYILSNLKSLDISFARAEEAIPLIQSMRTPNLVSLSFTDLLKKFMDVDARHGSFYDYMTLALFEHVVKYMPLQNLVQCSLSHIRFLPHLFHIDMYPTINLVSNPGFKDYPVPTTLLRFFCKLTALQYLIITDPDPSTLRCLNFTKPPIQENPLTPPDESMYMVPLPALEYLQLAEFHLPNVQDFILARYVHRHSFRRLQDLIFTVPKNWAGKVGPCPLALANNVEILGVVVDSDAEHVLAGVLPH